MEIVDGQLHEPSVWATWDGVARETCHAAITEALLSSTDAVGVDAAVLMPTDIDWAEGVAARYPGRFAVIPRLYPGPPLLPGSDIDPEAPDIEDRILAAFERPATKGLRFAISLWEEALARWESGVFDRALSVCARNRIPVFLFLSGRHDLVSSLAKRHPDLTIILDHMGIPQPPLESIDTPPWRRLDDLLALASYENIAVKVCGAPSLSRTGPPYADSWAAIERALEAFGPARLFWASDISRFRGRIGLRSFPDAERSYVGKHTYAESLTFFTQSRLSEAEKELILGKTIRRLLGWSPSATAN